MKFAQNLELELGAPKEEPGMQPLCAYFDEDTKLWTTAGLTTTISETGSLVCGTPHLTLFSAVLRALESAVMCANAAVLTPAALANIVSGGKWWHRPPALILWFLLFMIGGLVAGFLFVDKKDRARQEGSGRTWDDSMFFTSREVYKPPDGFFCCQKQ